MEIVNCVGIAINDVLDHKHLEAHMQFVCGLGPRKLPFILKKIYEGKTNSEEKGVNKEDCSICNRKELFFLKIVDKNIF